jgi:hypothetical protein
MPPKRKNPRSRKREAKRRLQQRKQVPLAIAPNEFQQRAALASAGLPTNFTSRQNYKKKSKTTPNRWNATNEDHAHVLHFFQDHTQRVIAL